MDILSFVNSPDMQKYFRKIKFKPNPVQATTIIARSCRPFEERMLALNDLVNTTEDCPVRGDNGSYDSLHDFLGEYLSMARNVCDAFWAEPGMWYSECDDSDFVPVTSKAFSSPKACLDWTTAPFAPTDAQRYFSVVKEYTPGFGKIIATFDSRLRPIKYVATDTGLQGKRTQTYFETIFAPFPTPFVRGDVLTQVNCEKRFGDWLFVLDKMDQWDAATLEKNGIPNRKLNDDEAEEATTLPQLDKYSWRQYEVNVMAHNCLEMETEANDITLYEYADACSSYYEKGSPICCARVSGYTFEYGRIMQKDYAPNLLDLCYAAPPSKNSERLLWEISKYLKNKIDAVELLDNFKTICCDQLADIQHKKQLTKQNRG